MGRWLEAGKKFNSVLLKHSPVLHALPWGDTNFDLIKVYDVSWDTKPDKLIHKSITYYHKLLSERRLQLDPRQSVLWCSSSHSNIGDISIVTGFSFLSCRFPSSCRWPALHRIPPVLVAVGESDCTDLRSLPPWKLQSCDMVTMRERFLGLSRQGEWPQVVLSQLSSTSVTLFPSPRVCLTFFSPLTPTSASLVPVCCDSSVETHGHWSDNHRGTTHEIK